MHLTYIYTTIMMIMMYCKNNFNEKYWAMGSNTMPGSTADPDYWCLGYQQQR